MKTFIALLRGINVGGHNKLPMQGLRDVMYNLGYQNADTYIQTGNVVFQAKENDKRKISSDIRSAVEEQYGFAPQVMVLDFGEMKQAIEANPFPEAESEPKSLHLSFLISEPSNPDLESLENYKTESERFELVDKVFYLHAPEGIGRSKLAGNAEKLIGVSMTGRNWRTVKKIMEMAEANE